MTTSTRQIESQHFFVEARPGGGWAVKLLGHATAITWHDTEEEAEARAAAYGKGAERAATARGASRTGARPEGRDTSLICAHCGEVIGACEPVAVVSDGEPRLTSQTAEPDVEGRGELLHGDCFAVAATPWAG